MTFCEKPKCQYLEKPKCQSDLNLNNTFGKPSTQTGYSSADSGGDPRYGGYASMDIGTANTVVTKGHVSGDSLCITSLAVINLGMHGDQHKNLNNAINELDQHIDKFTATACWENT